MQSNLNSLNRHIRNADWYFDYLSPYPYLQLARFEELPETLKINPKPVVFAALLNHWGHKGPAEIPAKARQTYLFTHWLAEKRGLPFVGPARHPFNPLPLLRLTIHLGSDLATIRRIYHHVWGEGHDGQSEESLALLAHKLGVSDLQDAIQDPDIKQQLKDNTDEAIARGLYGIPTFHIDDQLFWGDDVTDMFIEYLDNPALFKAAINKTKHVTPAVHRIPKGPRT
ncbi:MAG: 2-hydroxychromene-2-carboxylate isomerase [Acidimicrobiales bacterium]|nr:2-hydroxychromene-2-carboxylate isomerase [Hyphomonadaceae bacterium]RZV42396.1 MAG: 2-hydroxychromene-2-carboxylate isomerase [Acidimicrobiales bacterium]